MFKNREDAGKQLGEALKKYQQSSPIVLGIPRGGIEVGYYVARHLSGDFAPVIVRKLGYPRQPEAAFGAMAEDGSLYLDPWSNKHLSKEIIERVVRKEKEEIKRRIGIYRDGKPLPNLKDRVVLLVDDGIATGSTVFAALEMCVKKEPRKLIVAAPVSGTDRLQKLGNNADEVIILDVKEDFYAVSQGYEEFSNLTDREVLYFLDLWKGESTKKKQVKQT